MTILELKEIIKEKNCHCPNCNKSIKYLTDIITNCSYDWENKKSNIESVTCTNCNYTWEIM